MKDPKVPVSVTLSDEQVERVDALRTQFSIGGQQASRADVLENLVQMMVDGLVPRPDMSSDELWQDENFVRWIEGAKKRLEGEKRSSGDGI